MSIRMVRSRAMKMCLPRSIFAGNILQRLAWERATLISFSGRSRVAGGWEVLVWPRLKAIEKSRFRPTYAGANMGHPYRVVQTEVVQTGVVWTVVVRPE